MHHYLNPYTYVNSHIEYHAFYHQSLNAFVLIHCLGVRPWDCVEKTHLINDPRNHLTASLLEDLTMSLAVGTPTRLKVMPWWIKQKQNDSDDQMVVSVQ